MKKYLYNSKNLIYSSKAKSFILSAFYFLAIIGLSAMTGCNDESYYDCIYPPAGTDTIDCYRLVNPEMVYHAGAEFEHFKVQHQTRFSLSDREFLGKSYLQINIEDKPTDMMIRVDGDVIWGYDPQSENEFKMYDFSKWPLEQGDSLTYRIYEVNDNYEITGIADYSNILKEDSKDGTDFILGDSDVLKSRRCKATIPNFHDNIYEDSTIGILTSYKHKGYSLYSHSITCRFFFYFEEVDAITYTTFTYFQNFGMEKGKGLFFKELSLEDGSPTCLVTIYNY